MKMTLLLACLALAATWPALADEVLLHSGGRLQGVAIEKEDFVVVETAYGTVQVPRDLVLSIDRTKRSIVEEFRDRRDETNMENAESVYRLARWAKENRLAKHARELFEKAVQLDPNHEFARRELGFVLYGGRWLTQEEVMLAKGFVQYKNEWLTPSAMELKVNRELEEARRRDEERRQKEEAKSLREQQDKNSNPAAGRERVPEIWPTISTAPPRQLGYFYGYRPGAGIVPGAGFTLSADFQTYVENLYKPLYDAYGFDPPDKYGFWPFYKKP